MQPGGIQQDYLIVIFVDYPEYAVPGGLGFRGNDGNFLPRDNTQSKPSGLLIFGKLNLGIRDLLNNMRRAGLSDLPWSHAPIPIGLR